MQRRFSCYNIFLRHGIATSQKKKRLTRIAVYHFGETFVSLTIIYSEKLTTGRPDGTERTAPRCVPHAPVCAAHCTSPARNLASCCGCATSAGEMPMPDLCAATSSMRCCRPPRRHEPPPSCTSCYAASAGEMSVRRPPCRCELHAPLLTSTPL